MFLSERDVQRLAEHFSMSVVDFARKYTRLVNGVHALIDQQGHDCIFLKDKQCTVYEARPVQCKTFPWWVQIVDSENAWLEAAKHCEGINHPDAPTIPTLHIQEQCLTYLDNLIEQNFSV